MFCADKSLHSKKPNFQLSSRTYHTEHRVKIIETAEVRPPSPLSNMAASLQRRSGAVPQRYAHASSTWPAPAASGAQLQHNLETLLARSVRAIVYEVMGQFLTNMRPPVRACSRVCGLPASFMARGFQCSKSILLFVCKRTVHVLLSHGSF